MSHFADTSTIVADGETISAVVRAALDALDNEAKALADAASGGGATGFRNLLSNPSFETWEDGVNTPPRNWVGTAGSVAQEASIIKHGVYSAALTRSGADRQLYQSLTASMSTSYLANRLFTFGAWVYAITASRARLYIERDGLTSYSAYHSGSSNWEFLTITDTLPSVVTTFKAGLQVDTGNTTAYLDGAILVEGGVLYGFSDSTPEFNQIPKRCTMLHDEASARLGNNIAVTIATGQLHNFYAAQSPAAQNDAFTHSFFLAAGIYTFSVLGQTGANRAKCDWYVNEELLVSAQDWYNATTVANVVKTAVITIKGDGYHVLKGSAATRNASNTTGWLLPFTKYWFTPISD